MVMIMFADEVKDTATLLLFYLLVIWERGVLPEGNVFFRRRFRDDLLWLRAAGGSLPVFLGYTMSLRQDEAQGRNSTGGHFEQVQRP